jgi:hypothetical protein
MRDGGLELLYRKNRFLREIESAPPSDKTMVVLPWSVEEKTFSTNRFHPAKVHYRVTVDEIKKVGAALLGHQLPRVDQELLCVLRPQTSGSSADGPVGVVPGSDFLLHA